MFEPNPNKYMRISMNYVKKIFFDETQLENEKY